MYICICIYRCLVPPAERLLCLSQRLPLSDLPLSTQLGGVNPSLAPRRVPPTDCPFGARRDHQPQLSRTDCSHLQ